MGVNSDPGETERDRGLGDRCRARTSLCDIRDLAGGARSDLLQGSLGSPIFDRLLHLVGGLPDALAYGFLG